MKKIIISSLAFFICIIATGQVTNEKSPAIFAKDFSGTKQENITVVQMSGFNLQKIQAEDKVNDSDKSKPYRFGQEFKVDIDIKEKGTLDILPNGDHLYRIFIESSGAKTLNFVFNKYNVPTGAKIYLYNEDKTDVLGAYTNVFNRSDEMLGTWMVAGDKVCIEYREPKNVIGKGQLNLARVVHGYRSITDAEVKEKALNSSGDCNQDVDCPVGVDFDSIKDRLKHSIGFIIMDGFVCSGGLINNTNNDAAPYFLTANHCAAGPESIWAFRFNWISPNPSCSTVTGSTDAAINQTTSGATVLAANSESDVKLLRLDGGLDATWDLEFAGWDRSDTAPSSFVVGIHHPSGDIMKVSRENQTPTKRVITFNGNATTEMWNIANWDLGVTEGGSSGSPLFNSDGRIIGQLAGGAAACTGTNDNNQFDVYGRLDISWDFGTTNSTRLSNWLDPNDTGVMTVNSVSYSAVLSVEDNELAKNTSLFPNPSNGVFNITNNTGTRLVYNVFNILGQKVDSGTLADQNEVLNISSNKSGVYFVSITNTINNSNVTKRLVIKK